MQTEEKSSPIFLIYSRSQNVSEILGLSKERKADISETVVCEDMWGDVNGTIRTILENYTDPKEVAYAFFLLGQQVGHQTDSMGDEVSDEEESNVIADELATEEDY